MKTLKAICLAVVMPFVALAQTPELVKVPELSVVIAPILEGLATDGFVCKVLVDRKRNLGLMTCVSPTRKNTYGSLYVFKNEWMLVSPDFSEKVEN